LEHIYTGDFDKIVLRPARMVRSAPGVKKKKYLAGLVSDIPLLQESVPEDPNLANPEKGIYIRK